MRLGALELRFLCDGVQRLDGGAMFGVVPRVMWQRLAPPDDNNRIPLALRCLLVRSGKTHVLVDTGVGDKGDAAWNARFGIERGRGLLAELAALGLGPEDIDVVVNTHLHFDHAGGNTRRDGERLVPVFPRARYVAQKGHLDEARGANERNRRSYVADDWEPLEAAGVLDPVDGDVEVAGGVRIHLTPGHCGHHQSVVCSSGGHTAIFLGDLVPTAAHAPLPYTMAYDIDPLRTVETRRRIYAEALKDRWLLALDHEPAFACGLLERDGSSYRIVAAEALQP